VYNDEIEFSRERNFKPSKSFRFQFVKSTLVHRLASSTEHRVPSTQYRAPRRPTVYQNDAAVNYVHDESQQRCFRRLPTAFSTNEEADFSAREELHSIRDDMVWHRVTGLSGGAVLDS
jgi:hypothetical protein